MWFAHTLNDEREAQGKKTINSVWLSGGAGHSCGMDGAAVGPWGLGRFAGRDWLVDGVVGPVG